MTQLSFIIYIKGFKKFQRFKRFTSFTSLHRKELHMRIILSSILALTVMGAPQVALANPINSQEPLFFNTAQETSLLMMVNEFDYEHFTIVDEAIEEETVPLAVLPGSLDQSAADLNDITDYLYKRYLL